MCIKKAVKYVNKKRPQLIIDPKKCALLVIDTQKYFCDSKERTYLPASKEVLPNILKLVNLWKTKNHLLIYTKHCHRSDRDLGMLGKFYSDYIKCSNDNSNIVEDLLKHDPNLIIQKNTYDAFWNTELNAFLVKNNITQVLITGCLTHLCCETTARSAFVRGFEVYFISDGTFTSSDDLHNNSLLSVSDGFGIVHSVDEVLDICKLK